jgi:hypothetical protein
VGERTILAHRSVFSSDWFIEHRIEAGAADAWTVTDTALVIFQISFQCR